MREALCLPFLVVGVLPALRESRRRLAYFIPGYRRHFDIYISFIFHAVINRSTIVLSRHQFQGTTPPANSVSFRLSCRCSASSIHLLNLHTSITLTPPKIHHISKQFGKPMFIDFLWVFGSAKNHLLDVDIFHPCGGKPLPDLIQI